jgi:hypothetical protein
MKLTIWKNKVGAWYVKESWADGFRFIGSFGTREEAKAFKRGVEWARA